MKLKVGKGQSSLPFLYGTLCAPRLVMHLYQPHGRPPALDKRIGQIKGTL